MLMKKVTNEEIRAEYLRRVSGIPALNSQWISAGVPLIERARRAWQIRHDARVEMRALMLDRADVEALRRRDLNKYGNPDGPAFGQMVERYVAEGKTEDQAFEEIIGSSVRTDAATNTRMGLRQ